jgi:uncharacterized membrane protein YgaE (UPF0421/DUF939 family)
MCEFRQPFQFNTLVPRERIQPKKLIISSLIKYLHLAQPRNVIGGNAIAAIICVTLVQLFGTAPWVMAMAVATTIKVTQLTRTVE